MGISEEPSSTSHPQKTEGSSEALADCLLSQYRFCAGGVGLGAAYGIKYRKGVVPMVMAGVAGSFADLVYGYTVACSKEAQQYNASTKDS